MTCNLLNIPNFIPNYDKNKKYGGKTESHKINLRKLLLKTSNNHCMYCFSKIKIDRNVFSQLEHGIEKTLDKVESKILLDCTPNISITCPTCNMSYKKTGRKAHGLKAKRIKSFENSTNCLKCENKRCSSYESLLNDFLKISSNKIILQPFGLKLEDKELEQYKLKKQLTICKIIYKQIYYKKKI